MSDALAELRAGIEELPAMKRILPLLEGLAPAYLVGGAVRDLLRGEGTRDLDLVVEGPIDELAEVLAADLGAEVERHERFGTATLQAAGLSVDLARSRRERYPRPGALPKVEAGAIEEDLGRRDFSINAMATPLAPERRGVLLDPHGGRLDLETATVRVLHAQSFADDPTRLLRAVRYAARLGFALDPATEAHARRAAHDRVFDTVSGSRIGAELMLLLGEEALQGALARLVDLELDAALHPALAFDPELAARAAMAAGVTRAAPAHAALAALVCPAPEDLDEWLNTLGLGALASGRVARAARSGPTLAAALSRDRARPASALHDLLAPEPAEALALALALGAPPESIGRYLDSLSSVGLSIGGHDLIAAGIAPSPALGRALDETLRRKLDGEVTGREEELRVALELARGESGGG